MSKTLSCGCVIFSAGSFKFCPLHDAALDLLTALRGAVADLELEGLPTDEYEVVIKETEAARKRNQ